MRSRRELTMNVGKWLFAAVVPGAGLALGSLPNAVLLVVATLGALACALVWAASPMRVTKSARLLILGGLILEAYTLLQTIPLPAGIVRAIAPASADAWERALLPLHVPPSGWMTLSVAPLATGVEALRGLFYLCVLLTALRIAAEEHGVRFLERLVVASSSIMAVSALAHSALNAERVFGIYRPHDTYAYDRYSPLLNTNHLAAYLDVGAFVAVGALIGRRSMPRALSLGAAILTAGTSVWAGSRGGTAALVIGVPLTIILTRLATRGFRVMRIDTAVLALCALVAAVLLGTGLSDFAKSDLSSTDISKVGIAREALGLVRMSPWFGVGRGAFESVFPLVRTTGTHASFTHPENIAAQWATEWGVPVSVICAAVFAVGLRPSVMLRAARPVPGAWTAVVMSVLHDFVDFHLEVPGIVALVAICAGIVVSSRGRVASAEPVRARGPWFAIACAAATLAAVILNVRAVGHSLADERRLASEAALDPALGQAEFEHRIRASIERYPAESYFAVLAAARAELHGERSVVAWVGRALENSPHSGRAHYVLARHLVSIGRRAQARLEYRLAYTDDEALRGIIEREAVALADDRWAAMELVPDGALGDEMLSALVVALAPTRPSTSYLLDEELARRRPNDRGVAKRRVERLLSDVRDQPVWCGDSGCGPQALAAAQALYDADRSTCDGAVALAKVQAAVGQTERAIDELAKRVDSVNERAACQRELVELALASGTPERVDRELDRLVKSGCGHAADCYELYIWAASVDERRGHRASAAALYRRAVEVGPAPDDVIEHVVDLDLQAGLPGDAVKMLESLVSKHPENLQYAKRLEEIRQRALERPLPR